MKRYHNLDERILTNIINSAEGESISRSRARYKVIDVSAPDFDACLERHGIRTLTDRRHGAKYYLVSEVKQALKKLCLENGIRPKVNPDKLRA